MTVKELKQLLDTRPDESEVLVRCGDGDDRNITDCDGDSQTTIITVEEWKSIEKWGR